MKKIKTEPYIPIPVVPVVIVGANVDSRPNYMTAGFVSGANINPPVISVSLNNNHYTPEGIIRNGTFSINIPTAGYTVETDYCGLVSGKSTDKSKIFTSFYGELKSAPMIEEFPVTCECVFTGIKTEFSMDTVFFGEVRSVYINEDILSGNGTVDITGIKPLLSGSDNLYRTPGSIIGKAYQLGWEYGKKSGSSVKPADKYKCRLTEEFSRPALFIRHQTTADKTEQVIGESIFKILQYAARSGARPAGAPFVAYHGIKGQNINIEIGITFREKVEGSENIISGEIPEGKYASCTYTGPYTGLRDAHAALHKWLNEKGYRNKELYYEFYINDPRAVKAEKLNTRIMIPVE